MRAVIISSYAATLGAIQTLMRLLLKRGIDLWVLAPDYDPAKKRWVFSLGARPLTYPLRHAGIDPFTDVQTILFLRALLKQIQPQVLYAYNPKPNIYGTIAAWWAGVPYRYVHITGLGYAFASDGGVKRKLVKAAVRALYKVVFKASTKVFFQNADDLNLLVRLTSLDLRKSVVIGGRGVDLNQFPILPPKLQPITFTLMARLVRDKGVVEFAKAAEMVRQRVQDVRFLLLGGTDDHPSSISTTQIREWTESGILEWLGRVDNVLDYLAETSVFVLPSYREGLPVSSQEAMATGRPIITTDVPGCRETVIPGVNGFLVPPRDPISLADAMLRFIDEPSLIVTMGRASRRIAEERFDAIKQTERLIQEMFAWGKRDG